jgi:ribosome modulation factor
MTEPFSGPLRPCYELGQAAGQRGEPLDACRYRRPDRVNAWVRGWHAGEGLRLRLEAWRAERRHAPRRGAIHLPAGRVGP